jgi:hypothetical protein
VAARSKAEVCGRTLAGIVGSNSTRGMDVCLLWVLCVVRQRSLRRADPSSRGHLPTVVCVWVWSSENKQPRHLLWVGRRGKDYETKRNETKNKGYAFEVTLIFYRRIHGEYLTRIDDCFQSTNISIRTQPLLLVNRITVWILYSKAINTLCTRRQTADGPRSARADILWRERKGERTRVRWMERICAAMIQKGLEETLCMDRKEWRLGIGKCRWH